MTVWESEEQGRIRHQEFFADRFGLNALNQYLRRFQVVCRHAELDDVPESRITI